MKKNAQLDDLARLRAAEERISDSLDRFLAVYEINRDRLYQAAGFETFEAYAAERLGRSRATAYRWRDAGEAISKMIEDGTVSRIRDIPASTTIDALLKLRGLYYLDAVEARKGGRPEPEAPESAAALVNPATTRATIDHLTTTYPAPPPPPGPHTVHRAAIHLLDLIRAGALDRYKRHGDLRAAGRDGLVPVLADVEDAAAALTELHEAIPDVLASIEGAAQQPASPTIDGASIPSLAA